MIFPSYLLQGLGGKSALLGMDDSMLQRFYAEHKRIPTAEEGIIIFRCINFFLLPPTIIITEREALQGYLCWDDGASDTYNARYPINTTSLRLLQERWDNCEPIETNDKGQILKPKRKL